LFSQFEQIYVKSFPDVNEREEVDQWRARMDGRKDKGVSVPEFHLLVIGENLKEGARSDVFGGATIEYYKQSNCGLLTYIAVSPEMRKLGCARKLIRAAIDVLKEDAKTSGDPLRALFAEVNDPQKVLVEDDVMPPEERMQVLSRLGAKWIDVDYTQPSLGKGKMRVYNLTLITLPLSGSFSNTMSTHIIRSFLAELYKSLGVSDYENDPDFLKTGEALKDDFLRLKEMPITERPTFSFARAAASIHCVSYPVCGNPVEPSIEGRSKIKSFELDLLAHRYQTGKQLPLYSSVVSEHPLRVIVHYPPQLDYEEEGKVFPLIASIEKCATQVILSQTVFPISGICIWHVTFQPDKDSYFTEYDLIKLSKIYGGIQENSNLLDEIEFSIDGNLKRRLSFQELLSSLVGDPNMESALAQAGTIEIDMAPPDGPEAAEGASETVRLIREAFSTAGDSAKSELEKMFVDESSSTSMQLKALCGITTGIFGFMRMNFSEFIDTMEPTISRASELVRVHRGSILSLAVDDDMLVTCRQTIGISPYLVIPQAFLLHNDAIVDLAEKEMSSVFEQRAQKVSRRTPTNRTIQAMEKIRASVDRHLQLEYLPNFFQYETERQIVDRGASHRGSNEKMESARRKLAEMSNRLRAMRASKETADDGVVSVLLGILTGLGTLQFYQNLHTDLVEPVGKMTPAELTVKNLIHSFWDWGLFFTTLALLFIFLLKRYQSCRASTST
jgi:GNAT superfamily N-acetyltransferase